jgi:hypothetical protein
MSESNQNWAKPVSVRDLLSQHLVIPPYQRPYKWVQRHVHQLIDDILLQVQEKRSAYRIGTIVIHRDDEGQRNIVDGQQRTITLSLIAHAICEHRAEELKKVTNGKEHNVHRPKLMDALKLGHSISKANVQANYQAVVQRIKEFNGEAIEFFFNQCELVQVEIEDISEAFQFFDSQNARGKDLEPHDLLKAYHLREMSHLSDDLVRAEKVARWEKCPTEELHELFGAYLFRVRNWSKQRSARWFTKDDVHLFKGIGANIKSHYPYATLHRIADSFVDEYNGHYHRHVDRAPISFPFQIDGTVINGRRFFEMTDHYLARVKELKELKNTIPNDSRAFRILNVLDSYPERHRTGDQYVRNIFDCALLHYTDKFGSAYLDRAIEVLFVWAMSLRLEKHSVQLASVDNHALKKPKIFRILRDATHPSEVLGVTFSLDFSFKETTRDQRLKGLFTELTGKTK